MELQYNTYHAFERDGFYYIFDNEQLYSCVIEKHVYAALKNNDASMLKLTDIHMLKVLHDHNVFFVDNPQECYSFPECNMVVISMALFHGCNLNCKYCFADAGRNFHGVERKFTIQSINSAISFLLSNSYFAKIDYFRINLVGGGEPLLDKNLFRKFITIIFKRFKEAKKHLYVWFSTNGTLLTDDDLSFISRYNIGYGISIDGMGAVHDKLRIYPDGTGTYLDIVNNIKKIQQASCVPRNLKELWGLMVYTQESEDLLSNVENLYNLGFSTVQVRFVRTKDKNLLLNKEKAIDNAVRFIKAIFGKAIEGDNSLLRLITNDHDYFGKIIKRIMLQEPCETRCMAGSYMFSFSADGKIYPCDAFVGNPDFVMGSYYDTLSNIQIDKYKDLSVNNRKKCKICWAKYACGGDCYHNSYLQNNSCMIPDNLYCTKPLRGGLPRLPHCVIL